MFQKTGKSKGETTFIEQILLEVKVEYLKMFISHSALERLNDLSQGMWSGGGHAWLQSPSGKKSLLAPFCCCLNLPEYQGVGWSQSTISEEELILSFP